MSALKEEANVTKDSGHAGEGLVHAIDPFGAHGSWRSRISGLGGSEPALETAYVFRTADLGFRPGRVELQLTIDGLESDGGNLLIELVNRSSAEGSPPTRLSLQAPALEMIAEIGGTYCFTFEARRNTLYSVAGYVHGDGRVLATALKIFASVCPTVINDKTAEGARGDRIVDRYWPSTSRLLADEPVSFCRPCSQCWTSAQEREADFAVRLLELGKGRLAGEATSWSEAFILQVLNKFEVLRPGSRGLGLDAEHDGLVRALAHGDASVVVARTDNSLDLELDLGVVLQEIMPDGIGEEKFFSSVNFVVLRTGLPLGFLENFDFGWWIAPDAVDARILRENVARVIAGLCPGGIGVVVVPFIPDGSKLSSKAVISRNEIERAAIEIVSEGHDVVQLNVSATPKLDNLGNSRFGLIFRRGLSMSK